MKISLTIIELMNISKMTKIKEITKKQTEIKFTNSNDAVEGSIEPLT
jgi:hypothetical protein